MKGIVVLRTAFAQEWRAAAIARRACVLYQAFSHLVRAHILSQRITWWHLRCHLAMLRLGWLRRDAREIIGQVKRVFAALLFSRIRVPAGNTGGTNVSAFRAMSIPDDLNAILYNAHNEIVYRQVPTLC